MIWRPNVRVTLDEYGEVEDTEEEEVTKKGTKRKRALARRGRASTGEVSVELQGVQRLSPRSRRSYCKECGGASICKHNRERSKCKERWGNCEHGRGRLAWSAVGLESASTVVGAHCKSTAGFNCEHGRTLRARSAVGLKSASTVVAL